MVRWISLAVLTFALSCAQAVQQQIPLQADKVHLKKDAHDRAHKLLRHNPLIDTHNDLPMYVQRPGDFIILFLQY